MTPSIIPGVTPLMTPGLAPGMNPGLIPINIPGITKNVMFSYVLHASDHPHKHTLIE